MAETYKGLVIKFGADATELDKALKGIQTQSRKTYSDLRDINKSLKFNPGNTELLEQKTRALSNIINQTKDRLNGYKQALSQLEAKKQSGATLTEREQRQYEQLQRDILKCENQLQSYGRQLSNTSNEATASRTGLYKFGQTIQDNSDKLSTHGQRMESVGKTMTGVSVAVGGAAMAAFNDVDKGMDAVVKATGATGDAAKGLQQSVKDVAGTVAGAKLSWEQLGSEVGEINTRFGFTGDQLTGCSEKFAKFADVTGMDATEAVRLVSRAMGDAGIDSSEYATVLDTLTSASQASGISIDKLTENVTKYGAPMRALGFDTQSSIAIFSQWEKAGVNTEIAFSGMKKAISNWSKEGKNAKEEFGNMLQEIANCPDIASATTKAIEVFGAKAGPDLADAIQNGRFEYSDFMKVLENSQGTLDATFDQTVDGVDNAKVAFKEMQEAGAELGGALSEVAGPIMHDLAETVKSLSDRFKSLSPEQQQFVAKMALAAAGGGVLLTVFGKLFQSAGAIGGAIKGVAGIVTKAGGAFSSLASGAGLASGASGALSGAMTLLTGPVGIAVAAIAALVAGLTWFFTQTEQGRAIWSKFCDWLGQKWAEFQERFGPQLKAIADFIVNTLTVVGQVVGTLIEGFMNTFMNLVDFITNTVAFVVDLLSGNWEKAKEDAAGAFDAIKQQISDKLTEAGKIADTLGGAICNALGLNWDEVKQKTAEAFLGVANAIGKDMQDAQSVGSNLSSALKNAMNGNWGQARADAANAFQTIASNISSKMQWARDAAINAANWIGDRLGFPGLGNTVAGVFDSIGRFMTDPIGNAANWISSIPDQIIGWFQGLGDRISNAFGSIYFPSPHVEWGGIDVGDLHLPLPYVSWWATGGIFTRPTLLGGNNGVGEKGAEAVLPIERLSGLMAKAIEQVSPSGLMAAPTITVNVTAKVADNLDAFTLGQQIGRGVNSTLRQQGVA